MRIGPAMPSWYDDHSRVEAYERTAGPCRACPAATGAHSRRGDPRLRGLHPGRTPTSSPRSWRTSPPTAYPTPSSAPHGKSCARPNWPASQSSARPSLGAPAPWPPPRPGRLLRRRGEAAGSASRRGRTPRPGPRPGRDLRRPRDRRADPRHHRRCALRQAATSSAARNSSTAFCARRSNSAYCASRSAPATASPISRLPSASMRCGRSSASGSRATRE